MSIRLRLSLAYTFILIVVLAFFGSAVYLILLGTVQGQLDDTLDEIADQVIGRSSAFMLRGITILSIPEEELELFQIETYMLVVNDEGDVVARSENLGRFGNPLDPRVRGDGEDEQRYSTVLYKNDWLRVLTVPLVVRDEGREQFVGHLQVARRMNYYDTLNGMKLVMLLTGMGAISLSLLLGGLLTNSVLKPLENIAAVATQITHADDLGRRLPDRGRRDEIGRLTVALNATLERLERHFRSQQRFLADVSHELRTPLTAIRGNVDLIRRMGRAEPEFLDDMEAELERTTRLVNDLMLLARAEAGGFSIQQKPVELDNVFLDIYRQARTLAREVTIQLGEVDQVCVFGDADRLKQLLLNLADNAIKYTPAGGTVTLSLAKMDGRALVTIADSGIGIPEADLPYIFERFYRVDKARTRAMGGSGLGLSIAKWIAQAHDGEIRVKSEMGKGSTFTVLLPVYQGVSRPQSQPEAEVARPPLRVARRAGRPS